MCQRPEWTLHQRRYADGNNHIKRCSTLLIIRRFQIKTIVKYHCTPIITVKSQHTDSSKTGKNVEELELSFIVNGNAKWCSHLWKMVWQLHIKLIIIRVDNYLHAAIWINLTDMNEREFCSTIYFITSSKTETTNL